MSWTDLQDNEIVLNSTIQAQLSAISPRFSTEPDDVGVHLGVLRLQLDSGVWARV